ncbi:MAG: hypothetical protein IRZ08_12120 [Frankia sp.]|nr:hypothetical protein [Frankia sp.]
MSRWPRRPAPPTGEQTRAGRWAGLVCLLTLTVIGPPLGLLWAAVAPRLDVRAVVATGSETAFAAQADIDATFGFLCLGVGVIAGLVARWRASDAGWPVPVGLAIGGLAASLLAGWVGHEIRSPGVLSQLPANANEQLVDLVDMRVRSSGLYLVLPVAALATLALSLWLTTALAARRRGQAKPPDQPGWGGPARGPAPDEVFAQASAFRPVGPLPLGGVPPGTFPPAHQPPPGNGARPGPAAADGTGGDGQRLRGPAAPATGGGGGEPGQPAAEGSVSPPGTSGGTAPSGSP